MYPDSDMNNLRTIEQTAQETGVSADTLRYYERIGLITDIARASNGHRRYCVQDLVWIRFLKQLRATGMPIVQMKHFAQLRRNGDKSILQRVEMLEQYRATLEAQVQSIMDFISVIDSKIANHQQRLQFMSGDTDHEPSNKLE